MDKSGIVHRSLLSQPIQLVSLSSACLSLTALTSGLPKRLALAAFNAALVAIVDAGVDPSSPTDCISLVAPEDLRGDDSPLIVGCLGACKVGRCLGLAVVRYVDWMNRQIALVTPVDLNASRGGGKINLVLGSIGIPSVLSVDPESLVSTPYFSGETMGDGAAEMKSRTNVKRKRQQT